MSPASSALQGACLPPYVALEVQGNSEQRKGDRKMSMHLGVVPESEAERNQKLEDLELTTSAPMTLEGCIIVVQRHPDLMPPDVTMGHKNRRNRMWLG